MQYPQCKTVAYTEEWFGRKLEDPYRWLKNAQDPEVLDWVKRENEFTDSWFDKEELANKIQELKKGRLGPSYHSISRWDTEDGERAYAATRSEEGRYSLVRLNEAMDQETVIMERDQVAGFTPFELKVCPADPKKLVMYGLYEGAARPCALVVDSESRQILTQIGETFSCDWSKTEPVFYYSDTISDAKTQKSVSRVMGYDVRTGETRCIYEDADYSVFGTVQVSGDRGFVMFDIREDYSHGRFYVYEEKTGRITDITQGTGVEMNYVDTIKGTHYFIDKEKAPLGQVLAVKNGQSLAEAQVVRPEQDETLEGGFVLKNQLYLMTMANVRSKLICLGEAAGADGETTVELPDEIGTATVVGQTEEEILLQFESFLRRPMLLAFDGDKMRVLRAEDQADHSDLTVEQKWAPSKEDGKLIPYYMVYKKGLAQNGQNPVWMYGYGGYNSAMLPSHQERVSGLDIAGWAERGGIYVLCSLRGGNEFGSQWHVEGMAMQKKNCYYDFIGITEQLIEQQWTSPKHIAISGCSNGGLLMSTLVTMRPDLFGCVIDSVPHTDMIQFAEDDRGPMYITEYGNPRESREMFEYLLSYSPYHNVKKVDYPCTYIQTGECDNNVPPYHGKKFAARMQQMNQSGNPVLLRVLAKGSHDRGSGEVYWQTIAEMQLFAEKALGLQR